MIIECINCNKVFDVNSDLIPSSGRTIQCGSCHHVWFYNHGQNQIVNSNEVPKEKIEEILDKNENSTILTEAEPKSKSRTKREPIHKNTSLVKYSEKSKFTFGKFLNYIIVLIISFIALIIILDTFKGQLSPLFPNLELVLYNLVETLKDLLLFFKDLI